MKGYRTVAFNAVMAIVAVATIVSPDAEVPTADQVQSAVNGAEVAVVGVWTVGNMILRAITSSPIFKKE